MQFDVTWENSWRTSSGPANWDAAWLFVKFRVNGGAWKHASLNATGYIAPSGSTIDIGLLTPGTGFNITSNPGMGVFLYRSANGSGTFTATAAQLQWNYGANGVNDNDLVDVQVYGIEEVYVPQAAFYVGSGFGSQPGFEYGSFYAYPTETNPYQVTSEAAITVGTTTGNLYYDPTINDPFVGDKIGPIPAAFPKGYKAFYCMKYELSQQGYVDFLNNLNYSQSRSHYDYNTAIDQYRFHIDTLFGSSAFRSRSPYIACNFLSWNDLSAYLAWAGLRPMTELEYEKACRGVLFPVPNEKAWGTANVAANYYTIGNPDLTNEIVAAQLGTGFGFGNSANYNTDGFVISPTRGPLRVGIFAASSTGLSTAGRVSAGATYYGIMEMTGNVWEQAVTVGNPEGRLFTGTHGNGVLNASGFATNTDWPNPTVPAGAGRRGGSFMSPFSAGGDSLRVSGRRFAAQQPANVRTAVFGGRGVRTAP